MIDLGHETDGYKKICLGVCFALCIIFIIFFFLLLCGFVFSKLLILEKHLKRK